MLLFGKHTYTFNATDIQTKNREWVLRGLWQMAQPQVDPAKLVFQICIYTTWIADGGRHSYSSWFIMAPKTKSQQNWEWKIFLFLGLPSSTFLQDSRLVHLQITHEKKGTWSEPPTPIYYVPAVTSSGVPTFLLLEMAGNSHLRADIQQGLCHRRPQPGSLPRHRDDRWHTIHAI